MKRIPLYGFLCATAISQVGNYVTMIAVPWFVLELTGSALKTGLAGFCTALPAIIAAFFGGTIVDRTGHRNMSIISDIGSGITVAVIPICYHFSMLPFWLLLTCIFFSSLLDAPGTTARSSLLPDLAADAEMNLEQANSIIQAIRRGASLAGPALSGILISWIGISSVLYLNAASFGISAIVFSLTIPKQHSCERESSTYLNDLKEGLHFVRKNRLILSLIITVAITNFLDAPLLAVVIPVYARQFYESAANLGLMISAFGAGALAGTIAYGLFGKRCNRRLLFIGSFFMVGLPFWFLAIHPPYFILLAMLFLSGLAAGPLNPIIMTVSQEQIPYYMRGRVFGLIASGAYIATPIGMLTAGYLVETYSAVTVILITAAGYFAVTTAQLFNRALYKLNTKC